MSDEQKRRILIVSDSFRIQTGFSNVGTHIMDYLVSTGRWEVIYLGWFDQPTSIARPNIRLYRTRKNQFNALDEGDKYARHSFPKVVEIEKPDIVLSIGDTWMVESYAYAENREWFRWVGYVPVDGEPVPNVTRHGMVNLDWASTFSQMDKVVAFGNWGGSRINWRTKKNLGKEVCDTYIWHGVDTNLFRPLPKEMKNSCKAKFFNLPPESFLIGVFSRNQPRKAFDKVIEAFAKFLRTTSKDRPAVLYFHCPIEDIGWSLRDLADYYGVSNRVILNESLKIGVGVSNEQLNELYNACDITTLPTRGEGWGLTIAESMSCQVPSVVSSYSAHTEYAKEGCLFIKTKALEHEPLTNIQRAIVDVDDYVIQLKKLYDNPALVERLGRKARLQALHMDWTPICQQWDKLLSSIDLSKNVRPVASSATPEEDPGLMIKEL